MKGKFEREALSKPPLVERAARSTGKKDSALHKV
jgi:hypothetical protein